jgi:hypothetical protein
MIRQLSQCPYCQACEIALDDNPELVLNPDAGGAPCPHLVWVDGRYSQWELSAPGLVHQVGSIEFHWEHADFSRIDTDGGLGEFMKDLVNSGQAWEFAPKERFQIQQMSADEKATGPKGKSYTAWEVDGQAVFAQDATAFLAVLPASRQRQSSIWNLRSGDESS